LAFIIYFFTFMILMAMCFWKLSDIRVVRRWILCRQICLFIVIILVET
jgi:hypothetical protein